MPKFCDATASRALGLRGSGSSSTTSSVLSRCRTLLTTWRDLELPGAEREVEVLGLLEAHLADDLGQERRAGELLVRQVVLLERVLERRRGRAARSSSRVSRKNHWRILLRAREEATSDSQSRDGPRLVLLGREDLDEVAASAAVMQRHDAAVDLRAHRAVADVGVHRVGEVDRGRAGGERLELALRREDVHLVRGELREGPARARAGRPPPPASRRAASSTRARAAAAFLPFGALVEPSARRCRTRPSRASRACAPGSRAACPPDRSRSCAASGTC